MLNLLKCKEALQLGAAGAISGSATVKIIERNLDNQAQCLSELAEFVRNMKAATKLINKKVRLKLTALLFFFH